MKTLRGLTLVEVVVVIGLFVALTGIVYATVRFQTHAASRETAENVTQRTLRHWVGRIVRDVRTACYDPQKSESFTIVASAPTELRFTAAVDSDGDGVVDTSRSLGYRLYGGELQLWLGGSSWRSLVGGVSALAFTYLDARGRALTIPPDACTSIASVGIELAAEASTGGHPGSPPGVVSQKATAELRNAVRCS